MNRALPSLVGQLFCGVVPRSFSKIAFLRTIFAPSRHFHSVAATKLPVTVIATPHLPSLPLCAFVCDALRIACFSLRPLRLCAISPEFLQSASEAPVLAPHAVKHYGQFHVTTVEKLSGRSMSLDEIGDVHWLRMRAAVSGKAGGGADPHAATLLRGDSRLSDGDTLLLAARSRGRGLPTYAGWDCDRRPARLRAGV